MSTFDSSFEPKSVHLNIAASDGASELLLVNGSYNLVGQAIGSLTVDVPPGQYHVRQRIGDTEFIEQIDVSQDDHFKTLTLKPLDFPTPAPIVGTSTFRNVVPDNWKKPAHLVGKTGLRVAIRVPGFDSGKSPSEAALVHLRSEAGKLRIERMDGSVVCDFSSVAYGDIRQDSELYLQDVEVPPGAYVLVQTIDDFRQRCMPLLVHSAWSPRTYLLCPRKDDTSQLELYEPVCLENASTIYWPSASAESPSQPDLVRLEAARKALARGRSLGGFAAAGGKDISASEPMLALIDAYLVLKDMRPGEVAQARLLIDTAAKELGESFPDVFALRVAFSSAIAAMGGKIDAAPEPTREAVVVNAPPLLASSWRHLLAVRQASAQLSALMPTEFVPETSNTWFIWTESKGSRSENLPAQDSTKDTFEATGGGLGPESAMKLAAIALVALMEKDAVKGWVDQLVKIAADTAGADGVRRMDPLLVKLIDGLATVQNPLLQDAFGKEELVLRVLSSVNLPADRFKQLLDSLIATLDEQGLIRSGIYKVISSLTENLLGRLGFSSGDRIKLGDSTDTLKIP